MTTATTTATQNFHLHQLTTLRYMCIYIYTYIIYIHTINTHTHTHIYIYMYILYQIYIYIYTAVDVVNHLDDVNTFYWLLHPMGHPPRHMHQGGRVQHLHGGRQGDDVRHGRLPGRQATRAQGWGHRKSPNLNCKIT